MYIKSLFLENIRSYESEEIKFKEGINFLSGDIGSGKSSILQAIEFAFFGFKRGDLEGYHILRKGKREASVKLILDDGDEDIEIFRKLKKGKTNENINQEVGYIKFGKNLIELSPSELNIKIFDLLNFPNEFITKDKNLIYRFTIYTPQEQLKEILFADSEKRLEVIRKLFGIDKYKQLKDAISIYMQKIREDKKVMQVKVEPKQKILDEKEILEKEVVLDEKELKKLDEKNCLLQDKLKKYVDAIEKRDDMLNKLQENILKVEKGLSRIDEIEEQNIVLEKDLRVKVEELKKLESVDIKKEKKLKEKEIESLQNNLEKNKKKREELKDKIKNFEEKLKEKDILLGEISKFESKKTKFDTFRNSFDYMLTKCQVKDLENFINKSRSSLKKFEKIKNRLEEVNKLIIKNELAIENKKKKLEENNLSIKNIGNVDVCPSCFQNVSCDHRESILNSFRDENQKLNFDLEKLINEISKLKLEENELKDKFSAFEFIEKDILEKGEKLKLLKEKETKEKIKYEELKVLKKEILDLQKNNFEEKLKEFDKNFLELEKLNQEVDKLHDLNSKIKDEISKLKLEMLSFENKFDEIEFLKKNILEMKEKLKKGKIVFLKKDGFSEKLVQLNEKKNKIQNSKLNLQKSLTQMQLLEKDLLGSLTRIKTQFEEKNKQIKKKVDELKIFELVEKELNELLSNENLLSNKTLSIAEIIERTVLTKYYVEFNESFEELFKDLIEDNEIEVRLDESFSPIIEQNGYDIDIKNLSGGEKSSLALAYRLGLKKIIESNFSGRQKLSLLILDEPTDGFSNEQIDRLGNILKETEMKQILLVSHDEKIESIADEILYVEKVNHVSKIG